MNIETLSSSDHDDWMLLQQLYQQTTDTSFGFSDATTTAVAVATSSSAAGRHDHDNLIPKSCAVFKPIRRRSRASKRTPTTLLNADAKNFRSLVQQFTGCPRRRSGSTSISFGNPSSGPVNINFALAANRRATTDHHGAAALTSRPLVENYSSIYRSTPQLSSALQQQAEQQKQHFPQQQLSSEEQNDCNKNFPFEDNNISTNITTDDFGLTSCFPFPRSCPQGLIVDDMYFLQAGGLA